MNTDFSSVREASSYVARLSDEVRSAVLLDVAEATEARTADLLAANALDLARMDVADPRYDRLQLTEARLHDIAADLRKVAALPSPLGRVFKHDILPNGLELTRVSVPFGVIGIIFEARPNVCFDCFALCLKAGSACVLKGGSDARDSCTAIVTLIHEVLQRHGLPAACALLLTSHEDTDRLLTARGQVDLIIPRGSSRLINYVREHARVPVIETGAGVVHCYVDRAADLQKAIPIVVNAKTRRVSVCNALDCLIIHRDRLADLPAILEPLIRKGVTVELEEEAFPTRGKTDSHLWENLFPFVGKQITIVTAARRLLLAFEVGLHGGHARVDDQKACVVLRDKREARQAQMPFGLKEAQKHLSELVYTVFFHTIYPPKMN